MDTNCKYIPYQSTGSFSKMVIDYLEADEKISPFYQHQVSIEGIAAAIAQRKTATNLRPLLVEVLKSQYANLELSKVQQQHLDDLLLDNTFTITTAHQPNIFTGHLYFIYKILHTVKLAEDLAKKFPENNFVPVYYMGSEDADLDELGHINLDGEKLEWNTSQTGAVGRMKVDKALVGLIDRIAGRVGVLPYGDELVLLLKQAYHLGESIQNATLILVHELFKAFGVLVVIPDNADLKRPFNSIVKNELTTRFSHKIVEQTASQLSQHYKVQASGRDINLFYLVDEHRERIELADGNYTVVALKKIWTPAEILKEVDEHPERFSANVILRGVFQEMILPNIAFIGGGGELAYWLELKEVFKACDVPYPVLVLRNSFVLMKQKHQEIIQKLGLTLPQIFQPEFNLMNELVNRDSERQLKLSDEKNQAGLLYQRISDAATAVDPTLTDHVSSLQKKVMKTLVALERKMLRAEKKHFQAQQRQLAGLKKDLFPSNNLQERVDNFALYYAEYGSDFMKAVYENSHSLNAEFGILTLG